MFTNTHEKYRVQILERAIDLLFTFSDAEPSLSLEELTGRLAVNKTSLLRILRTLEAEGFVRRDNERYELGPRVLGLANQYLSTHSVTKIAQRHMEALARACGQTVSLAVLDGADVVYVAIEQAQRELGIQGTIGGRHPVHATALGKVLLAGLAHEDAAARVRSRSLERLTHRTLVEPEDVLRAVERVRQAGYAVDDEERGIGIRCIAAPVHDYRGRVIAALSVAGPIFTMQDRAIDRVREDLLATVHAIDDEMGYEPGGATVGAEDTGDNGSGGTQP